MGRPSWDSRVSLPSLRFQTFPDLAPSHFRPAPHYRRVPDILFHSSPGDGPTGRTGPQALNNRPNESYGQSKLTFVDRLGVWLSERAVARELPKGNDLEVLELGCGYHATHLLALGPRLRRGVGVDIQIAPELSNRPNLVFHEATIEDALSGLATERFDAVLLISVLEHLRDPLAVLQAVRHLLRSSGVLLINV